MDLLHPFICCLPSVFAKPKAGNGDVTSDPALFLSSSDEKAQAVAKDIIAIMQTSNNVQDFERRIAEEVTVNTWTENIAVAILNQMENLIRASSIAGGALKEAFDRAMAEAEEFVHEHPYFSTLIALGILVILLPWVVEALGFGELGVIEGSFAALWQSTYRGFVPKGSLFSYLQRLGMVWKVRPAGILLPAIEPLYLPNLWDASNTFS